MTDQHPITPPPELFAQWLSDAMKVVGRVIPKDDGGTTGLIAAELAIQAARWGADQELKACCEWADTTGWKATGASLRAARRPKPPSLKEQALQALQNADGADHPVVATVLTADQHALIRRALEQLDD